VNPCAASAGTRGSQLSNVVVNHDAIFFLLLQGVNGFQNLSPDICRAPDVTVRINSSGGRRSMDKCTLLHQAVPVPEATRREVLAPVPQLVDSDEGPTRQGHPAYHG